jgi:hypothetical protein
MEEHDAQLPVKADGPHELAVAQLQPAEIDMPPEQVVQMVERRLKARTRILRAALSQGVIGRGAFTLHGSGDRAKPYLNGEAVMRAAPILGIVVEFNKDEKGNMAFARDDKKDDDPDEPRFFEMRIAGKGYYADRPKWKVEAIGVASSRDGFFKRGRPAKRQPIEAISEGNVRKKAQANLWARIGQVLLGVKGLSVAEIEAAGYSFEGSAEVRHDGKGPSRAPARRASAPQGQKKDIRAEMRRMLLEMAGGDVEQAAALLETFTGFDGDQGYVQGVKSVDERRFTDKWAYRTYGDKVKPAWEKWKAQEENPMAPAPGEQGDLNLPDEEVPF